MNEDNNNRPVRFGICSVEHQKNNGRYHAYLALVRETETVPELLEVMDFNTISSDPSEDSDCMSILKGMFWESSNNLKKDNIHLAPRVSGDEEYIKQMWDYAKDAMQNINKADIIGENCRAGVVRILRVLGLEYEKPESLTEKDTPYRIFNSHKAELPVFSLNES